MTRRPETGESQRLAVHEAGQIERPETDSTRTEKRRGFKIRKELGDGIGGSFGDDHLFGVPAGRVSSCGAEVFAQIFQSGAAERTRPACVVNPADAHAVAQLEMVDALPQSDDFANRLMSEDHGKPGRRRAAFDLIEFCMADAAGGNLDEDLARPGFGIGPFFEDKRMIRVGQIANLIQRQGFHRSIVRRNKKRPPP